MPETGPAPEIEPYPCGDAVCLTVDDAVALAKWRATTREVETALRGCHLVKRVAQ